ncbi:MAG: SDR family NAD(P)-dependent oxidoreductase [Hyphomicrobiaceae bacterium]
MIALCSDPFFDISGKSIVIAGACGGLGSAISNELSRRGANLVLADIDAAALEGLAEALPSDTRYQSIDATDEEQTIALMQLAADAYGGVDALVNATGVFAVGLAKDLPLQEFRRSMDVNVAGALLLSRAAAHHMSSAGGSIIHLASVSSRVANAEYAAYASSKAALSQLVRILAREWAPSGIRVNALGPAMTETQLTARHLSNAAFQDQALAAIPMGRFGRPEDLLAPILMLIGDGGSFITGQTIYVDGGRTLV